VRKTIIGFVLLVAVVGPALAVALWWRDHYAAQTETHTVGTGDLVSGVTVSGTIRSKQREAVAAEIIAAVRAIRVDEGQAVTKGQALIELDANVIAAEVAKAEANVALATHRLEEMEAGPRPEEKQKAEKQVSRAKAELAYAEKHHASVTSARQQSAATQSELDLAFSRLESAKAELGYAQAEQALLDAGTRQEHKDAAKAELRLAEAELQRLKAVREKYTLRAAHAGVVTLRQVNVGEVVSPGEVLLRVHETKDLEVRAQVQESQLSGVRVGGPARVLADAYAETALQATIERVLPRVDPEQGTVTVLLKFSQTPPVQLMDGMATDIALIGRRVAASARRVVEFLDGRIASDRRKEG